MISIQVPKVFGKCQPYLDGNLVHEAVPGKTIHVNTVIRTIDSASPLKDRPCKRLDHYSGPSDFVSQLKVYQLRDQIYSRRCLCRSQDSSSSEDEYRSSRNIAITIFKRYKNFEERGGGDNLKEFISAGVNAYALGCTEDGLRRELIELKESGIEIQVAQTLNRSISTKSKLYTNEVDECILWLSIIFITILCTPQPTVVRWSATSPVSEEMILHWKGFCAIIANAYYLRGMAWLPVKTLQLEQMAVVGQAEEPSVVASRMRLVFSTLEVVSPQWPKV
ncbi:hypothetical protein Leryth_023097 [Lithospermum erythrorhizon]|uniref:DUF7876 domain-containing protein n=1 Tax=Lithospermum erythrorhizon TaxID=34254 RepID=A0AAV3QWR4_LITER|nr:hypothetical protein Leryth_023097 [Lithospermum erythrorhizon]